MPISRAAAPVPVLRMTFDEEFDLLRASPDGSSGVWMTAFPYSGIYSRTLPDNHEGEYYSDSSVGTNPFSIGAGTLNISATPAAPGSNPYGLPYTSGLITTYQSFTQTYGYFEVRAQLPSGVGLWPAFWMVPTSGYTSEIDIFESIGADSTHIYSSLHGITGGAWTHLTQYLPVPDTSTGFHTYGANWEPSRVTFYVDGQAVGVANTPSSMNQPMCMLLNLAVGGEGSWPGPPDASTSFPAVMKVDYVRAYANQYTTYVGGSAALPTSPSAPDTIVTAGNDQLILDRDSNVWTIINNQVAINGIVDSTTSRVTRLAYVKGVVWEETNGQTWQGKTSPTAAWNPAPATTRPPITISVQNTATGVSSVLDATRIQTSNQTGATFKITGPGVTQVTLGTTPISLSFIGMKTTSITGGGGTATVKVDSGAATIIAGRGVLDVTGGPDADNYQFHQGDGGLVIRDFANGTDTLSIQTSLKAVMKSTQTSQGLVLGFATSAGSIQLPGITSISNASIHWT